jgi:hypothetical protein
MSIVKINTTNTQGSETNVDWIENGEVADDIVFNRPIKDVSVVVNTVIDTVNDLAPLHTIADLRAFEPTNDKQVAVLTAGLGENELRGGQYQYDSTDTTSVENTEKTIVVTVGGSRWKYVNQLFDVPLNYTATLTNALEAQANIRFDQIQSMVTSKVTFATKADMEADLNHDDSALATVWDDTAANNGIYGKVGASGSGSWKLSAYDPYGRADSSIMSEESDSAGVKNIRIKDYHEKGDSTFVQGENPWNVTMIKEVGSSGGGWHGGWIEIRYDKLSDLDVLATLNIETVSGLPISTVNIVNSKIDWNSTSNSVSTNLKNEPVNLYNSIQNSSTENFDYYESANVMYLAVAKYNANDANVTNAAESVWNVSLDFKTKGRVIANEITSELASLLSTDNQATQDEVDIINQNLQTGVNFSINAGIEFIPSSQVYPQASTAVTVTGEAGTSGITITKVPDTNDTSWYAARVQIPYDTIEDLDKDFNLNFTLVSGAGPTKVLFTKNNADWSGAQFPVNIENLASNPVNFYELIINSDYESGYRDQNELILMIANETTTELAQAAEGVWNISPIFAVNGAKVVASDLSSELKTSILAEAASQVTESARNAGISSPNYDDFYAQFDEGSSIAPSESGSGVTYTQTATGDETRTWYALRWEVRYNTIEDLNSDYFINLVVDSGTPVGDLKFTKGQKNAFGPTDDSLTVVNGLSNSFNLYEIIMASSLESEYRGQNVLYMNLNKFLGSPEAGNANSVWSVDPYMLLKGSKVVASFVTEELREDLVGSIATIGKNITFWGDSLTAQGGWTSRVTTLSGYTGYNGGTGGENCRTILARQGADVMITNHITIPASLDPVLIADRDVDTGISTVLGHIATPLLQGGAHINPCFIGDVEGILEFTGTNNADMTGDWVFTRTTVGDAVVIDRPTPIVTDFDRNHNDGIQIQFIGQNGGYDNNEELVYQNRLMLEHSRANKFIVLGVSSGSEAARADIEAIMLQEFGRNYVSLRAYLAAPIYANNGTTITSCYGLDDAGLTATQDDLNAIATGTVPPQCLADSVHYTTATKTVIGEMLYKYMVALNYF